MRFFYGASVPQGQEHRHHLRFDRNSSQTITEVVRETLKNPKGSSMCTEGAWVQRNIWYHNASTGVDDADTV